jgi:hypothetical protein
MTGKLRFKVEMKPLYNEGSAIAWLVFKRSRDSMATGSLIQLMNPLFIMM